MNKGPAENLNYGSFDYITVVLHIQPSIDSCYGCDIHVNIPVNYYSMPVVLSSESADKISFLLQFVEERNGLALD